MPEQSGPTLVREIRNIAADVANSPEAIARLLSELGQAVIKRSGKHAIGLNGREIANNIMRLEKLSIPAVYLLEAIWDNIPGSHDVVAVTPQPERRRESVVEPAPDLEILAALKRMVRVVENANLLGDVLASDALKWSAKMAVLAIEKAEARQDASA